MKLLKCVSVAVLFLGASLASAQNNGGELTVNLTGANGIVFSGTVADSPTGGDFASLDNASTFDFFVTTPDDILVFDFSLNVTSGSVHNDTTTAIGYGFASNTSAPPAVAITNKPWLGADSFIQTPGQTACAQIDSNCPGFENVPTTLASRVSHFDSSSEGAQTDYNWGRITMIPDATTGEFAATLTGRIQVANQPDPLVENFDFTLGMASSAIIFEDVLAAQAGAFNTQFGSDAMIAAANDASQYPQGVTMFVPTDAALQAWQSANPGEALNVGDLLLDEALAANPNGADATQGLSDNDLIALVTGGQSVRVTALSGNEVDLTEGSVLYGGATVISSHAADNGWVHVLGGVPNTVPEPGSLSLLATALLGFMGIGRKRR